VYHPERVAACVVALPADDPHLLVAEIHSVPGAECRDGRGDGVRLDMQGALRDAFGDFQAVAARHSSSLSLTHN
jgi:hypothetical protein